MCLLSEVNTKSDDKIHVDFVARSELTVDPSIEISGVDLVSLWNYAERYGSREFEYTLEEHKYLRNLAISLDATKEFVANFDRTYNFIYWMTRKFRTATTNSIGAQCYIIALRNYTEMAQNIERYITQVELADVASVAT